MYTPSTNLHPSTDHIPGRELNTDCMLTIGAVEILISYLQSKNTFVNN